MMEGFLIRILISRAGQSKSGMFGKRKDTEWKLELEFHPLREVHILAGDVLVGSISASYALEGSTSLRNSVLILRRRLFHGYTFVAQAYLYASHRRNDFSYNNDEKVFSPCKKEKEQTYVIH